MSEFMVDTLVWTGGLIAAVLLLRRPVAKVFGPGAAYALWALPMARLVLPPIVLPAWMAPAPREPQAFLSVSVDLGAPSAEAAVPAVAAAEPIANAPAIDWSATLLAVWLIGAALFLVRRYALYFRMRRELLAAARPVGAQGAIRLVESPGADGPVAFGVIDKVVALPVGFMATRDTEARDLALAHEFAHHRGHDLLCNMLVQPLFALHWFNPLSAWGWRALRRDQEAACDARVIAAEPRERRATYAAVITRYAASASTSGRLALAAPMACPVLGDRSIVQRLRSLTKPDISTRRRWAGRLLLGTAALAMPLTASISYAQADAPAAPEPPVPPAAIAPVAAPDAPEPPAPPAWTDEKGTVHDIDAELARTEQGADGRTRIVRIERHAGHGTDKGKGDRREVRRIVVRHPDGMSAEERAEFDREMAEFRREMAENSEIEREMRMEVGKDGKFRREIRLAAAEAHAAAPRVRVACREGQQDVTESVVGKDGREELWVCRTAAISQARRALAEARAEIARERDVSAKARAEALRSIDEAEKGL